MLNVFILNKNIPEITFVGQLKSNKILLHNISTEKIHIDSNVDDISDWETKLNNSIDRKALTLPLKIESQSLFENLNCEFLNG